MQRFVPLLAVIVLLVVAGVLYGPAFYRNYSFQRDVEAMLAAARAGNLQGVAAAAEAGQQADAQATLEQYVPADYAQKLAKLSLSGTQELEDGARYAIVVCRIEDGGGTAIYSGKLRWVWNGKRWDWDFFGSYAAPYQPAGETRWIKLEEILPEASSL